MEYKNSFIGIDLPSDIRQQYIKLLVDLKEIEPHLSIVNADFSHITMLFLSSCSDDKLDQVIQNSGEVLAELKELPLHVRGFGVFSPEMPYVLFLHVEPRRKLIKANSKLSEINSITEQQAFYPHLTVGRLNTYEAYNSFMKTHNKIGEHLNSISWKFEANDFGLYVRDDEFVQRKIHTF